MPRCSSTSCVSLYSFSCLVCVWCPSSEAGLGRSETVRASQSGSGWWLIVFFHKCKRDGYS